MEPYGRAAYWGASGLLGTNLATAMGEHIDKLLALASQALGPALTRRPEGPGPGPVEHELYETLARRNGFYAFESALHVLPLDAPKSAMDLGRWNADALWRHAYEAHAAGHLFFAEDVFGCQFAIRDDRIFSFDPETGASTPMASSLDHWAQRILADYEALTGFPLAHAWQLQHGAIPLGKRLLPKTFFVLGGAYAVDNLYSFDAVQGMLLRAELAAQIEGLPDGATVRLTAGNT